MESSIVEVKNLVKYFEVKRDFLSRFNPKTKQFVRAVDDITFNINKNEIFGLIGESGSGKTTTGKLILNILKPTSGKIIFEGNEIENLKPHQMKPYRRKMQVIFQDPYASLNPRMKIGKALMQPLEIHKIGDKISRKEQALHMLESVGLTPPELVFSKYPHQLSGGQRQRVVIARALILKPDFIIADEPIAMADVSIRVLLLELMMKLKEEFDLTYLFITHDLATAKYICNRFAIMYLGKIVEIGTLKEVYKNPLHPYTKALLSAVPVPDPKARKAKEIPEGEIPNPINPPPGCRFHPRCKYRMKICSIEEPQLKPVEKEHQVACFLYKD
ncbi:oligopeptide ABC transporter ATP-binding protein [Candidatus Aerophobetes bacterium]|uniref:Oligopeptide ABC transporter ATP-binding protein n=1 Tax=Aerophobetes bacterium TaxID=2030807 RepID=A0A662DDB3_UNCAE|nr:MAG: oligopeptide ABC transporter ATP-binding protein [Candidatus Aerophobetes bacterium]